MAVATRIPRYNKSQKVFINGNETTLIEHLKELRTEKKITKKKISNIIKQNDTWYSQIERNGKNGDDNRQKTIYKPDLINIIAIVKYGAMSISDLGRYREQSETYVDKIIKAIPLEESTEKLEWYQLNIPRTPSEQERLFESLIDSLGKSLRQSYNNLNNTRERDSYLDNLKEINSTLKTDAPFLIKLAGLPFSQFLYDADRDQTDQLIKDVVTVLDKIEVETANGKAALKSERYLEMIKEKLNDYIEIAKYTRRNNFELLNPDEITF